MTNYPEQFISNFQLADGTNIILRPVRNEDGHFIQYFFHNLSSESKHSHFSEDFKDLSTDKIKKLTQINYTNQMVVLALCKQNNNEIMVGMAQYAPTASANECEVLVIVADEWHQKGIATQLMNQLIKIATENSIKKLVATIPAVNMVDISFAKSLGFDISNSDEPTLKNATKLLT